MLDSHLPPAPAETGPAFPASPEALTYTRVAVASVTRTFDRAGIIARIFIGAGGPFDVRGRIPDAGDLILEIPAGWPDRAQWADLLAERIVAQWPGGAGPAPVWRPAEAGAPLAATPASAAERIASGAPFAEILRMLDTELRVLREPAKRAAVLRGNAERAEEIAGALDARRATLAESRRAALVKGHLARVNGFADEIAALAAPAETLRLLAADQAARAAEAERQEISLTADLCQRLAALPPRLDRLGDIVLRAGVTVADLIAAAREEAAIAAEIHAIQRAAMAAGLSIAELGAFDLGPRYRTSPGWGGVDGGLANVLRVPGLAPRDAAHAPAWAYAPPPGAV